MSDVDTRSATSAESLKSQNVDSSPPSKKNPRKSKKSKTTSKSIDKNGQIKKNPPRNRKANPFRSAIWKLIKQEIGNMKVSTKSLEVFTSFVMDTFRRLVGEASELAKHGKKDTIQQRDVLTACKLTIGGELGRHAMMETQNALAKFSASGN
ncbi:MAG: uncharacterized protein KVP18_004057 [Porospora cf. gigantea A]|uniref:uncharacterized protein n=1 Tax=Porospora cf. gigantea A TaxID=2853593 RepID=UPI0035596B59|nr:MAG: hypothetical protein KVP18_004057 [Porospora cf. gigantea A]